MAKTVTVRQSWRCLECEGAGVVEVQVEAVDTERSTIVAAIVAAHSQTSPSRCFPGLETSEVPRTSA